MPIKFTRENGRGIEHVYTLPSRREVCEGCEGYGTRLHPDIGGHAYSAEEFAESFDDEERGEYFKRGGMYDVQCSDCRGEKVVDVVDEEELGKTLRGRRLLALYFAKVDAEARYRAEVERERGMGY